MSLPRLAFARLLDLYVRHLRWASRTGWWPFRDRSIDALVETLEDDGCFDEWGTGC